jgi:hypothetical protein
MRQGKLSYYAKLLLFSVGCLLVCAVIVLPLYFDQMKCVEGNTKASAWFQKRYNQSVTIFWEDLELPLDIETYRWWAKIRRRQLPRHELQALVMDIAEKRSRPKRFYPEPRKRCLSCAVVGTASNLLGKKKATEIDAHDIVIRLGLSPLEGFEEDLGIKVTHYFVSGETLDWQRYRTQDPLVFVPYRADDLHRLNEALKGKDSVENPDQILLIHPGFIRYVQERWKDGRGCKPSERLLALIMAIHLCDSVDVYGFVLNEHGCWDNYFNEQEICKSCHLRKFEEGIYSRLRGERVIKEYLRETEN